MNIKSADSGRPRPIFGTQFDTFIVSRWRFDALPQDAPAGRSHCGSWICERGVTGRADSISSSTCPVSCLQDGWSLLEDGVFLSASKITWMMNLVPFMDTSIDRSLVHHQSLYTHILTYRALWSVLPTSMNLLPPKYLTLPMCCVSEMQDCDPEIGLKPWTGNCR